MKYRNAFYNPQHPAPCSQEFYEGEPKEEYKGYLIFELWKFDRPSHPGMYHIVKDGVCVGMNAGLNGARSRIDSINFRVSVTGERLNPVF